MKFKPQPWQLIVLIAAVCSVVVGGMVWYHSTTLTPAARLRRLPADSLVVYIDFAELRRTGFLQLLGGAKEAEQPDYRTFVHVTRFDYMNDLDNVLLAVPRAGGFYFLAQGRFDWTSLRNYVEGEAGKCVNSLCRLTGSTPDKHISFMPLRPDLMAMAVSEDSYAVNELGGVRLGPAPAAPQGFIWMTFPGSLPKTFQTLPDGARSFARIVENAPLVTLSFEPEGARLAARLEVRCRNEQEAADLATQLTSTTQLVRNSIEREHAKPNPADFSGIWTSGVFHTEGVRLLGYWPIEKAFVQNLLGTS